MIRLFRRSEGFRQTEMEMRLAPEQKTEAFLVRIKDPRKSRRTCRKE